MKFYKSILLGTVTLAMLSQAVPAWADGEVIGVNSAVKGSVTVQTGEMEATQAVVKKPIHIGDEINSQHLSSLQVLLKDQTVFTVGQDCILTIDKFVYDPSTQNNKMTANVAKGMFRFMSGNISKSGPDSVNIDTPVASMGVRGTMVEGIVGADAIAYAIAAGIIDASTVVDRQGATLFILRGPGRKNTGTNKIGEISVTSGGKTVVVQKNNSVVFVASRNASPIEVGYVADALEEAFSNRLRTKPKGGKSYKPFALDEFMKKDVERPEIDDVEFFNPTVEMDWPGDGGQTVMSPGQCTPSNPNYPSCLL